jgi:hypothetical protein
VARLDHAPRLRHAAPGVVWRVASDHLLEFFSEHLDAPTRPLRSDAAADDHVRIEAPAELFAPASTR